jgi:RHS repeat-associated protein
VFTENEAGKPVAKKTIRMKIGERSGDLEGSLESYLNGSSSSPLGDITVQTSNNSQSYAQLVAQANGTVKRSARGNKAGGDAVSREKGVSGRKTSDDLTSVESLVNTYYFNSYDGKLLAEYDHTGICVRDYIYYGNMLLAEYLPQQNKYYYYASDQVSSVRMVTDDSGTVVYSAAYAPYGQIQQTWVNTYQPKLQFSGKEREAETGLDYFGARYYAHGQYRFISVDPIINKEGAFSNPQLWNLYAYCRNNPITFLDLDGRDIIEVTLPGIGRTYLDAAFYPLVKGYIESSKQLGIEIIVHEAFRHLLRQAELSKDPSLYAAKESLHEAGFAIDIKWALIPENMKGQAVQLAKKQGLSWGGEFTKRKEPWHFYKEVPGGKGKRTEYIERAQTQFISHTINSIFLGFAPVL